MVYREIISGIAQNGAGKKKVYELPCGNAKGKSP
jgi:hypothetical protein